jgi:pimeloyl-ACP methyl ester carboxylesterase
MMQPPRALFLVTLLAVTACHEARATGTQPAPHVSPVPVPVPVPDLPAPPPPVTPPPPPATVESLAIPDDTPASIVRTSSPPTTVFLPGLCSNASAYLQAFPEAARRQGGIVALEGDQPCVPGFRSFSWDAAKLHARIEAATTAAGLTTIPSEGLTLVGYSQGAALAEQLVQRWPSRYTRIVLIGAPTDPSEKKLATARAVVTMSCSRDVPWKMKEGTRRLVRAGVPSTYLEMPNCTHGNITEGDATFDAAFTFLHNNTR